MKISKTASPSRSVLSQIVNRSEYAASLSLEIQTKRDIKAIPSELEKFVSDDLSAHTVLVLKHRR